MGQANDNEAAVARMTASLLDAVNRSDLTGVLSVWSDDGVLMPPHHPSVQGRVEIERYFARLFEQTRLTFSFTASQIHVSENIAVERVEYTASAHPTQDGAERLDVGKGLHVYRRQANGSWRLVMDIWNSDTPARTDS